MALWDHPNSWANKYADTGGFPPECVEFMEWYILPKSERNPTTAAEWSREHNVPYITITAWKRRDDVRKEMNRLAEHLNVSSFRTQEVVNALYNAAIAGDTKAMTSYLEYVKVFQPVRKVIVESEELEKLSDEEIKLLLAEEI